MALLKNDKKFAAFTLAEVLITLSIIGIVAAMTIPSVLQNTHDAQYKTAWKKAYSDITQATMIMTTYNSGRIWDNTSNDVLVRSGLMRDEYDKYLKFIKKDTTGNTFPKSYKYYKGTGSWNTPGNSAPAGILLNGTVLQFESYQNCSLTKNSLSGICGYIFADINGLKGPNMFGKDFFSVWIVQDSEMRYSVIPMGSNGDGYSCLAGSTSELTSDGCSALALRDADLP